jgi:hypothetical protein
MPTHDELAQFLREYSALSPAAQEQRLEISGFLTAPQDCVM